MTASKSERNRLLARVHIAKKELGMGDDVYRDFLAGQFGKGSAAELSVPELQSLVRYFYNLGWEGGKKRSSKPTQGAETAPTRGWMDLPAGISMEKQKRYVAALWGALGYKMSGLDYRCKKQFGVDAFRWLKNPDHLQTLAKDLVNRCKRRGIEHRAEYY